MPAQFAAYFGEQELAQDLLQPLGGTAGGAWLQMLWAPALSDVRADPRFKTLVRDLGLYDLWRTTGEWSDFCRPVGDDDFTCF